MPIHLPPISRRRFLGGALAAAGGLALGPDLLAADRGRKQDSWALLSEPAFGRGPRSDVRGINMTKHLRRRRRNCSKLSTIPEGVSSHGRLRFTILENWPIIPC